MTILHCMNAMYKECYAQAQGTLCTRNVMYKECYVQATLKC